MDYFPFLKVQAPSDATINERVQNLAQNDFVAATILQKRLEKAYTSKKSFHEVVKNKMTLVEKDIFDKIFGLKFREKIENVPIASDVDVDAIVEGTLALEDFVKARMVPENRVYRYTYSYRHPRTRVQPKKPVVQKRTMPTGYQLNLEQYRIIAGQWGYRQIAKNIRVFLELGEVGIDDTDRASMKRIFLSDSIQDDPRKQTYMRLVFVEFYEEIQAWQWEKLLDMDKSTEIYKKIFDGFNIDVSVVQEYIENRLNRKEDKRIVKQRRKVQELKLLAKRQALTTNQSWDLEYIFRGDWNDFERKDKGFIWKQAVERAFRRRCQVCNDQLAVRICTTCDMQICQDCYK